MTSPATNHIHIDGASRHWRRRLGALPWAVLEELALIAIPTEHCWSAPIGVRDRAALAITKNTEARAMATLRSAGIAQPARVARGSGPPRPGYVLNLPDGLTLDKPPTAYRDTVRHQYTPTTAGGPTTAPPSSPPCSPKGAPPQSRRGQRFREGAAVTRTGASSRPPFTISAEETTQMLGITQGHAYHLTSPDHLPVSARTSEFSSPCCCSSQIPRRREQLDPHPTRNAASDRQEADCD